MTRGFLVLLALLSLATLQRPLSGHAASRSQTRLAEVSRSAGVADRALLRASSLRLRSASSRAVVGRLRQSSRVRKVRLGQDRSTIDVVFKDGREMLVLPKMSRTTGIGLRPRSRHTASQLQTLLRRDQQVAGARAAVLEPFATELSLGPDAGSPEVNALQASGFTVDRAIDSQVSVAAMLSLPSYAVVYMHTHSGVTQSGMGVVATGEVAGGDPAVQPYLADGSVMIVGVAGSGAQYYGITSRFISAHEGPFRRSSIIFINGCALLQTTDFWSALSAMGAGVMVSWDNDSTNSDNYLAGAAFFNVMQNGTTVSGAIQTLKAGGYGISHYNGQTATLGFVGDGSITLNQAAASGSPAPTLVPTASPTYTPIPTPTSSATSTMTPTATPSPTFTNVPTATETSTPIPLTISGLSPVVKPGQHQSFDVHAAPATDIAVQIAFPNGNVMRQSTTTNDQGAAHIDFRQAASLITHGGRSARVTVSEPQGVGTASVTESYLIGFARIDVSVEPAAIGLGKRFTAWVHSSARSQILVELRPLRSRSDSVAAHTGPRGWAHLRFTVEESRKPGVSLTVRARLSGSRKSAWTSTKIRVT